MFGQACFATVRANHRRLQQMPNEKQDKALARVAANFTEQSKIYQTVGVQDDVGVTMRKYKQLRTRGSQHARGHARSDNDLDSADLSDDFHELRDRQVVEDAHDMADTRNRKLVWVKDRHRRLSGNQTLERARRGVGGGPSSPGGAERARGRTEPAGDDVHDRDPPGKKHRGSKSGAAGAALPDDGEGKTEGGVKSSAQAMAIEIQKKDIDGDLLPLQPAALEGGIGATLDSIKKQLDNAKMVKPRETSGRMESAAALQAQLKDLAKRRGEPRSAVNFCDKEVRDKERADGQKVDWAKYANEKRRVNGGFGKLRGKKLSPVIYALQGAEGDVVAQCLGLEDDGRQTAMALEIGKPRGEVDLDKFAFWPTGHETIAELAKIYGDSQVVKDKMAAMQAALTSNPSWAGAVVNIEGLTDAEEFKRIFGQGPSAFALPGVAAMVYATEKPAHVQLSEVGPVLEKGFCIKEYTKYLESSDGQSFLDANAWAVRLQPFLFFYMPDGFIVLRAKLAKAKAKASDKAADAAFLASAPAFTDAPRQLGPKVRKAIHSYNLEVIKSKGNDPKWENRGMKLNEYFNDAS
ncbi:unnamed protein product [Prorocentrum cordatum]|uniref:Uncharacterized protein n=1 Tax=Prorocentrum cordatum TaxID=2364126 RepID=A0ABN9WBF8_9DINO|nr:unnamed protein product [Polarella glacialis]